MGRRALEHIGGGAGPERFGRELRIIVHGQKDEPDSGKAVVDPACGLEPAEPWHGNVADNGIRPQFERGIDQGLAIGHPTQDGEFRLQQPAERLQQQVVVVGEQQSGMSHRSGDSSNAPMRGW